MLSMFDNVILMPKKKHTSYVTIVIYLGHTDDLEKIPFLSSSRSGPSVPMDTGFMDDDDYLLYSPMETLEDKMSDGELAEPLTPMPATNVHAWFDPVSPASLSDDHSSDDEPVPRIRFCPVSPPLEEKSNAEPLAERCYSPISSKPPEKSSDHEQLPERC